MSTDNRGRQFVGDGVRRAAINRAGGGEVINPAEITRAFVNVAIYGPIAWYSLQGQRPPAAFLALAGAYTLAGFSDDARALIRARQASRL